MNRARVLNLGPRTSLVGCTLILALVATVVTLVTAEGGAGATKHIVAFSDTATTVLTSGPHAFPSGSCASGDPISLLLPTSAIPNMSYQVPAYAGGGRSIFPLMLPNPSGTGGESSESSYSSSAVITQDTFNTEAPPTAIEADSSFNEENPNVITSFSEGITGFTNGSAEATYFKFGDNTGVAPQVNVDGVAEDEDLSTVVNDSAFPTPNYVTSTSLPGTDALASIEVTIEAGSTVIGMTFMGGSGLTVADVSSYVQQALSNITSVCPSMNIVPS